MKSNQKIEEIATPTSDEVAIKNKGAKEKYGLPTAISLVVGIMIGSGIFLKNADVIKQTHSVGLSLISWIIGGIGILCAALALVEIMSAKHKDNKDGIISWSNSIVNKKFANVVAWFFMIIYMPIIYATLAAYAATFTAQLVNYGQDSWLFQFGLSILFFSYFIFANSFSNKHGRIFQLFLTIFKLIPLAMIILFGIFAKSSSHIFDPVYEHGVKETGSIVGILFALPAILFAFDGFYYVANTRSEMKNPKKTLPKAILIGIIFAALFYALFSVAVFSMGGAGNRDIASGAGGVNHFSRLAFIPWFSKFLDCTVIIATLVGLNGYTVVGARIIKSCSARFRFKFDKIVQKESRHNAPLGAGIFGYIFGIGVLLIALFLGFAYSAANNTHDSNYKMTQVNGFIKIIDFLSNWETIIELFLIAIILGFGILNRFKRRVEVDKKWYFIPTSIIAILFFVIVLGSNIIQTAYLAWGPKQQHEDQILMYVLFGFLIIMVFGLFLKNSDKHKEINNKEIIKK